MLKTSPDANKNYLAKVVQIDNLRKHSNADRLQITSIDFQDVITGLDAKLGDLYVYFPVDSEINPEFLSWTNSFRDSTKNRDTEQSGFFEKNRVTAVRLRGERSQGYIVPLSTLVDFAGDVEFEPGQYFDTWNDILMVKKYIVPVRHRPRTREDRKPQESRLIDGQFRFHTDTENLRKNIHKLRLTDNVSLSYKLHGTSIVLSNLLVKRQLKWYEKLARKLGIQVQETEYDYIYSSRKVVKNAALTDRSYNHYCAEDIWTLVNEEVKSKIPEGYSLYGEIVGFLPNGGAIQSMGKAYDYGCKLTQHELYVYRITFTNSDGLVSELTTRQILEFCQKTGLKTPLVYFIGTYRDLITSHLGIDLDAPNLEEKVIRKLEELYNEKDCWMCTNKVPEEGIVLRVEKLFDFEAYKLKSFRFLEKESAQETLDIETEN